MLSRWGKAANELEALRSELEEARKDLENGTTTDKLENILFLENAIDCLEWELGNNSNY